MSRAKGATTVTMTTKAELVAQYAQLPLDKAYVQRIVHDVRNRMNTLVMATEMLHEDIKIQAGDPQKYVNMIDHASEDVLLILDAAVDALKDPGSDSSQPLDSPEKP